MTNIRIEMNFYRVVNEWVVMVLFNDDAENVSSSICQYPSGKREAKKVLKSLETQYGVQGTINE